MDMFVNRIDESDSFMKLSLFLIMHRDGNVYQRANNGSVKF